MYDDQQPIIVPPIVRIPQVSPQVAARKRWVYIPPEIRRDSAMQQQSPSYPSYTYFLPQTPMPLPSYGETDQLSPVDDMMRYVSPYTSSMSIPVTGAIPRSLSGYYSISERRPDPGMGEILMGCASLLVLGVMVLVLLYFLSV